MLSVDPAARLGASPGLPGQEGMGRAKGTGTRGWAKAGEGTPRPHRRARLGWRGSRPAPRPAPRPWTRKLQSGETLRGQGLRGQSCLEPGNGV